MLNPKTIACSGLAVLLLCACGDQASTDYQGESLLTIDGRVELLDGSADGPIVPALAFRGAHGYFRVMDVEVEGEFPAGFTLHIFDPPPREAIVDYSDFFDDEPTVAVAFITAAAPDHAAGFQHVNSWSQLPDCNPAGASCHRVRREFCHTDPESEQLLERADCYFEVRECEFAIDFDEAQDYRECELVESGGNPELGRDLASYFYGFSLDHQVYYLGKPAPEGSLIARLMGSPEGVSAGYHLVHARARSQDEIDDARECNARAQQEAFDNYLEDHPETTCELYPAEGEAEAHPLCPDDDPEQWKNSEGAALAHYTLDAQAQRACPVPGNVEQEIVDTTATELSIRIGYGAGSVDLNPFTNGALD